MKLRRAMALAAATAVMSPAALLAAPAAYATDGTTSTTTGTTGGTDTTTDPAGKPADGTRPAEDTEPAEGVKPAEGTGPAEGGTPAGEPAGKPAEDTKPAEPTEPGAGGTSTKPAAKPGTDPEPAGDTEPADPEDDSADGVLACEEASIKVSLGGFPNKIVAGSGWKTFTFDVENTGKGNIESLDVYTVAGYKDNVVNDKEGDLLLGKYAHFEYKDPESGEWVDDLAGSGMNNGVFFASISLDAGETATIELRLRIDKAAPAGDGLAIAAGGYMTGEECFENGDMYPFAVVKAGAAGSGDVEDSKPTGQKPRPDVKPQGEARPIPVEGNLAETGSSSMLPAIGITGGIAVVAGAGVMFALKRRRAGMTA
ncbi:hypothetical protein ACLGI4_01215 [Streptomyces sp. HMX112]|uniref:hypothetical protein n=1 Tax=Streptomyces sp. HMX112 TaxID=3390850 RepID=UPI003A804B0F